MPKKTGDRKKPDRTLVNSRVKVRQDTFLAAYGDTGTTNSACKATGINRSSVYAWKKKDVQDFNFRLKTAHEIFREGFFDWTLQRIKQQKPDGNPMLNITFLNAVWPEIFRRDIHRADDGAKDLMGDWKTWTKDYIKQQEQSKKTSKEVTADVQEEQRELEERKNAIDEVEKILSRRKNGGEGKKSKG